MYRVQQVHYDRRNALSVRNWNYKTEAGAKRRVWLCEHSRDNFMVYYYHFVLPVPDAPFRSTFIPNSHLLDGFDAYLRSKEVEDDE